MRSIIILITIIAFAPLGYSATWYVPGGFPTIQGAISDPSVLDGDTIIVKPGTYVENIDFLGKAITVRSDKGATDTVIDGGQPANPNFGSVVTFQSGEKLDSVLDGFTITNGKGTWYAAGSKYLGGGIYCRNHSSPTIINNIVTLNSINGGGAGIYCIDKASPSIMGNIITENSAGVNSGAGGIYCWEASPTIANNLISKNTAMFCGGIYCGPNVPTVMNNIITKNSVTSFGGGMYCYNSDAVVTGNTISDNTADMGGGGIWITEVDASTITGNIFKDNSVLTTGNWGGGGIGMIKSTPTITNNILSGNSSAQCGGAISMGYCPKPLITNNSISGNWAVQGGGIRCFSSTPTISNTILWNNDASFGPEIWIGNTNYLSTLTISYSDVEGGKSSVLVLPGCTLNWGPGMIDANPLFVNAAIGDLHLTFPSPCKDTGNNADVTELTDFEGDSRIAYGTVDMGADEFYTHLYWTGDATPGGNVEIKLVGLPNTSPVGLFIGFSQYDPPLKSMWGDWYVAYPWILFQLGAIPNPGGVLVLKGTLPGTPPGPYTLYMQALIGAELSNLCVLEV